MKISIQISQASKLMKGTESVFISINNTEIQRGFSIDSLLILEESEIELDEIYIYDFVKVKTNEEDIFFISNDLLIILKSEKCSLLKKSLSILEIDSKIESLELLSENCRKSIAEYFATNILRQRIDESHSAYQLLRFLNFKVDLNTFIVLIKASFLLIMFDGEINKKELKKNKFLTFDDSKILDSIIISSISNEDTVFITLLLQKLSKISELFIHFKAYSLELNIGENLFKQRASQMITGAVALYIYSLNIDNVHKPFLTKLFALIFHCCGDKNTENYIIDHLFNNFFSTNELNFLNFFQDTKCSIEQYNRKLETFISKEEIKKNYEVYKYIYKIGQIISYCRLFNNIVNKSADILEKKHRKQAKFHKNPFDFFNSLEVGRELGRTEKNMKLTENPNYDQKAEDLQMPIQKHFCTSNETLEPSAERCHIDPVEYFGVSCRINIVLQNKAHHND